MVRIGCIADDFTGATDLAGAFIRAGLRVVQCFGVPEASNPGAGDGAFEDIDVLVVALKTRSAPAATAVEESVAAIRSLRKLGAERVLFKYCSTFDSTPQGNIGPVSEALLDELNCKQTIFCPAFPKNGRTQYMGRLFVGRDLLSESGMRNHPLTPMTDSNLVNVLESQVTRPVGLVDRQVVAAGAHAIEESLVKLQKQQIPHVLVDAVSDSDLREIAQAARSMRLVTGGSAIAEFLPEFWRLDGLLDSESRKPKLPRAAGATAVLSGSCSEATQRQVAHYSASHPSRRVDLLEMAEEEDQESAIARLVDSLAAWALEHRSQAPLIYSTASVEQLAATQQKFGVARAADLAEQILSGVAATLAQNGFAKFIVAGGETSGSIVQSLGVSAIRIGPEICPGVPWCESISQSGNAQRFALALKSGNFGGEHFFEDAQRALEA